MDVGFAEDERKRGCDLHGRGIRAFRLFVVVVVVVRYMHV